LAVRQNVAKRYGFGEINTAAQRGDIWKQIFEVADKRENEKSGKKRKSELLPFWGLTSSDDMVKIERYVYNYPFSRDEELFLRLMKTVSQYRAVLGQPNQEELLVILEKSFQKEGALEGNFEDYFINLSPFMNGYH
jgi:hypothetical protein